MIHAALAWQRFYRLNKFKAFSVPYGDDNKVSHLALALA
jgi:hypothetical protein